MKSKKGPGSDREKDQGRIDTPVGELSEKDTIMHYNAVMLEELKSQMKLMFEFLQAMQASICELNQKFEAMNQRVEALEQKVVALDRKVDALNYKLDALEERLTARIDKIAIRLDDHEGRIAIVESYH